MKNCICIFFNAIYLKQNSYFKHQKLLKNRFSLDCLSVSWIFVLSIVSLDRAILFCSVCVYRGYAWNAVLLNQDLEFPSSILPTLSFNSGSSEISLFPGIPYQPSRPPFDVTRTIQIPPQDVKEHLCPRFSIACYFYSCLGGCHCDVGHFVELTKNTGEAPSHCPACSVEKVIR